MARYAAELNRTASLSLAVGSITCDATTPRRGKLYEMVVGSDASPADNTFQWQVQRCTTAGTGTGIVPTALDSADALALSDVAENHTVQPALTAGAVLLSIPLNQRATFRWVAAPYGELVYPATASNGFAIITPVAALVAVTATVHFEEQ